MIPNIRESHKSKFQNSEITTQDRITNKRTNFRNEV